MSKCMVYTINNENFVVSQFECDREIAMQEYHNRRTVNGRYLIANLDDIIPFKWKRKPLKYVKYSSVKN